jgi:hypothetical protein
MPFAAVWPRRASRIREEPARLLRVFSVVLTFEDLLAEA